MTEVSAGDVRAQAEQFMQLLTDLRVEGTPEALQMRQQLVTLVTEFRDTPDREQAKAELVERLMTVEAGIVDMMAKPVRALRDRLHGEKKRIGRHSQAGKAVNTMYDALGTLLDALQQLRDASTERNHQLRDSAHALLAQAKAQLQSVGMR